MKKSPSSGLTSLLVATGLLSLLCMSAVAVQAQGAAAPTAAASTGPTTEKWEKAMLAFEENDKKSAPPADAALFIGSSSIRRWSTLAQDFAEIPTINRGFGGSTIADSTRYVDRIVVPVRPRLIVMYAGGNDLASGKTPAAVLQDLQDFVAKVRKGLPEVPILYLSLNPTLARWNDRERTVQANRLVAEYMQGKPHLQFIDAYSRMLGADGLPQKGLLAEDGLHPNSEGYRTWTTIMKPQILKTYGELKR